MVTIAETADRLGYHHLTCSEHIAVPAGEIARDAVRAYYDPLATFATSRPTRRSSSSRPHVLVLATTTRSRSRSVTARSTRSPAVVSSSASVSVRSKRSSRSSTRRSPIVVSAQMHRCVNCGASWASARSTGSSSIHTRCRSGADLDRWPDVPFAPLRAVELADGWCPFGLKAEQITEMLQTQRRAPRRLRGGAVPRAGARPGGASRRGPFRDPGVHRRRRDDPQPPFPQQLTRALPRAAGGGTDARIGRRARGGGSCSSSSRSSSCRHRARRWPPSTIPWATSRFRFPRRWPRSATRSPAATTRAAGSTTAPTSRGARAPILRSTATTCVSSQ